MTQKKQIILIVVLFIALIIGWSVYLLIPKSYIVFQIAPEQAYIKIDDNKEQVIKNGDKIFLSPGEYSLIIYRDEFNPQFEKLTVKNSETKEIIAVLKPLTEEALKLLQDSSSDKVIEKATGVEMDNISNILQQKYPILKSLPLSNKYYRVTSCQSQKYPSDRLSIALCIDVADGFKDLVYSDLKQFGYELKDYEIIWKSVN